MGRKHIRVIVDGKVFCSRCKIKRKISLFFRAPERKNGYRQWCKICMREYSRQYKHKDGQKSWQEKTRGTRVATKLEVFTHYGNKCKCCGESNMGFLTIDHVNNDGKNFKFKIGKTRLRGHWLYRFLIKNNYPDNVIILCFNCNIGRANNKQICPHKNKISQAH